MENTRKIPKKEAKSRFSTITEQEKDGILYKKNKENTNKATKLWIQCFWDFLIEKGLPDIDLLANHDLPAILEDFYASVCKKPKHTDEDEDSETEDNVLEVPANPNAAVLPMRKKKKSYKNTSMKAIRGALCRYFKDKRSIDIMSGEAFICANSVFTGILQINKEKGLGNIESKSELTQFDMNILQDYIKKSMVGPPNPHLLQEIVIFYVLFYMCRRGRENLRFMTKDTFAIKVDPSDNRKFIFQAVDEADKNHTYNDTTKSNDGRIYEDPGS